MAKPLSFRDVLVATAKQKSEAARARFSPSAAAEKPKEVILAACDAIAANLRPDGFSFARSGPRLKRVQGDLTFTIAFQSDRNNIAGRRAAVWIHAGVSSKRLAEARRSNPMPWGGGLGPEAGGFTGGQIGNLVEEPSWLEWDFADQGTRQARIDDAIATIRSIILPFFALFDEPARTVELLIHRPALWQSSLIEYASVAVGNHAAEAAGHAYLKSNPDIRQHFDAAFSKFRRVGLPSFHSDLASDLAAIAVAKGLDFLRHD